MLKIEFEDNLFEQYNGNIIDPEDEFTKIDVLGTDYVKRAMQIIDQATYVDIATFIDRFGRALPIKELSIGCKIAILVQESNLPKIHSIECGFNARDFIICNANRGTLIMYKPGIPFSDLTPNQDGNIDVYADDMHFTSLYELNEWLF